MIKKIVIDTETTGLHPEQGDEILQVSIIDADTKAVIFNQMVRPAHVSEWADAMAVNRIRPEDVADKPEFKDYRDIIQDIINSADDIIGYNTFFDINFLRNQGVYFSGQKVVDVMVDYMEEMELYKWAKLVDAAYTYAYDWAAAPPHDSLGDVYATLYVYQHLKKYKGGVSDGTEHAAN